MPVTTTRQPILKWSIAALILIVAVVALLAAELTLFEDNQLRGPLAGYLSQHTGRPFRIEGDLQIHLLSSHPSLVAGNVTVGNPPWAPAGTLADIGKLTMVFDLPWSGQSFAIRRLALEHADIHLQRDADGHANWLWKPPGVLPDKGIPVIYSLSLPNAHVRLDDNRRHLQFDGTLTTRNLSPNEPLRLDGQGQLNGRRATFSIRGDSLATVTPDKPYAFTLEESSSGSRLTGHGSVKQPFDFRQIDGSFEAGGPDLKDLFFLVGVRLPNTGPYRLTGKLARHNARFELNDLVAISGESDVRATVTSQMDQNGNTHVDVDLRSQRLKLSDLGLQAAGRATVPPNQKPLFPQWEIRVDGIRRGDVLMSFHVHELTAGPATLHAVAGKMLIDHGIVTIPNLTGIISDGSVSAQIKFDARPEIPKATLGVTISNVRLGQLSRKDPEQPPMDGLLHGRLDLRGRGRSIHELVANADGTVTAVLSQGTLRASLAELIGFDLRALGLMLTKNTENVPVRCGVAHFLARAGTLTAAALVVDTAPMLITGSGSIQLGTEQLELQLQGQPKHVRLLRLQVPVSVHGTLKHPAFGVQKADRKFKLVDLGHGRDVDCSALLAEVNADGGHPERVPGETARLSPH